MLVNASLFLFNRIQVWVIPALKSTMLFSPHLEIAAMTFGKELASVILNAKLLPMKLNWIPSLVFCETENTTTTTTSLPSVMQSSESSS